MHVLPARREVRRVGEDAWGVERRRAARGGEDEAEGRACDEGGPGGGAHDERRGEGARVCDGDLRGVRAIADGHSSAEGESRAAEVEGQRKVHERRSLLDIHVAEEYMDASF